MLTTAFVILCTTHMLHLTRHWWRLTRRLRDDARAARLRSHLNWAGDKG